MWANGKKTENGAKLPAKAVQDSAEYAECVERFSHCTEIVDEAVGLLLGTMQSYESHSEYSVIDQRIGYKDQDGISFEVDYGYHTLWAHFREHDKGRIPVERLEQKLAFTFNCGQYSYAEVLKQFSAIMGVTGTLRTLTDAQKSLLSDVYNISKHTYMPSVYGASKCIFPRNSAGGVRVEPAEAYFPAIKDIIVKCED